MRKSSAFVIGALSSFVMIAPGMVRTSTAAGSAFEQKKATDEQQAYKALSLGGMADLDAAAPAPVAPSVSTKMWPGVPGMAAPAPIVSWKSTYDAPRGGREY